MPMPLAVSEVEAPQDASLRVAQSSLRDPERAAQYLASQLLHPDLEGVLFFCSAEYDLPALATALEAHLGGVTLCGCTTAGELGVDGYSRGSIVALGFDRRAFTLDYRLIHELDRFTLIDAQRITDQLFDHCLRHGVAPLKGHTFAMTLLDGLSACEEQVLLTLTSVLAGIPHFGGSAGDDNRLTGTHVYGEGAFHAQAAVVLMINTALDFEVLSTHHLRPRGEKLVVTAADSEGRRVLELNAEPAAQEYARLVGCPVEALGPEVFARHPLAVRLHDKTYVRAIQGVNRDLSLSFYCAVETGIVMTAMQGTDLLEDLACEIEAIVERLGPAECILACDCFLRRLELEQSGLQPAAGELYRRQRILGFNTYGEHCNGLHLNQTFSGVFIGRSRRDL
ncbi:FIST C-terminal domain-containing protein [Halomonas sp. M5N1S17]|uniref:nitric oxide-sensing protein NosP n=1 Tax=Halomonas alkalisoli TaxID=2907158 RepID=UPI001F26A058|nr:nitric oxide-sensing protein NosP [Halomonas alkalisoli]MCE9665761.1 FIST C-terminal domain-containing protein [Halomonas alkalisoli]